VRGAVLEDVATGRRIEVRARVVVDGTDLGDVIARAGAAFDVGLEADSVSGEKAGVAAPSDVVQDLTWCAVLKDYGPVADRALPRPAGYDPAEFDCSSTSYCHDAARQKPTVDAQKMLDYARLPNGKYLLNWPIYGNDAYLNVVALDESAREKALEAARARTLRFVYFIQHELGFRQLGLADDEFPTPDRLALLPYHREGRRLRGVVRFTSLDIEEPFGARDPLYRTGVSVGDYPIDHHHKRNPGAPQHLWFVPVPSFSVPLGALLPEMVDGLVVADKAISVSNLANGTTRLQPVVLLTGQAAGALAALAARQGREPRAIPVRDVQRALVDAGAFLLPYLDVPPSHPMFAPVQRVGATGILRGHGVPHQWANQTWFYPDFPIDAATLQAGLAQFEKVDVAPADGRPLTVGDAVAMVSDYRAALLKKDDVRFGARLGKAPSAPAERWTSLGLGRYDPGRLVTRGEVAALVDAVVRPFDLKAVDHRGHFVN
ncbi:MAG TPA: FAD-dependent oxidoreductase, partial [Coriobacteriia bacterium]